MLKNYLKIALRNLAKQKTLAFINIFGLSVGIACFSLFLVYAMNEFSFDRFHKWKDDIYLVINSSGEQVQKDAQQSVFTSMPIAPALRQEIPDVENYVRFIQPYEVFIKVNGNGKRENIAYADSSFFSFFSFPIKYGAKSNPLGDPNKVVLSEETAQRLFGKSNAVGQSLEIKIDSGFEPFMVSAITENPPTNSSIQFNMLANFSRFARTTMGKWSADNWGWMSYLTFVQLKPGSRLAQNTPLLTAFKHRHFPKGLGSGGTYLFEPLLHMHINPHLMGLKIVSVDPKKIWILLATAGAVLLIACINFTTLSIGRSMSRAKEVGVRKVSGGTRGMLQRQFISESLLLTVISTTIGLFLTKLLLPFFNGLSGKALDLSFTQFPQLIYSILLMVLIVGFVSGSYPALVLSNFSAFAALKTKIKLGGENLFTKSLVTLQFVISTALIIGAVIIVRQLNYMHERNPGFAKEDVVVVEARGIAGSKTIYGRFKQELSQQPEIVGIGSADYGLGEHEGMNTTSIDYNGNSLTVAQYNIDPDYIPVLGMRMLAGRNFDSGIGSDTVNNVIINETFMHRLGWTPENSIGRKLDSYSNMGLVKPTVVGIVRDFNYMDLTKSVEPLLFHHRSSPLSSIARFFVRIRPGDPAKALAAVEKAWKTVAPDYPLSYNFLDEDLDRFYQAETRLSGIIGWAGGIAIFLACLGLLGLAALAVANRTREMGIRKVLGASIPNIIQLLSKGFLVLIVLAFLIAAPISWWLMNQWLQDYAYRVDIQWWIFALIGIGIIGIALMTIVFQALRAARANPVKSLRIE